MGVNMITLSKNQAIVVAMLLFCSAMCFAQNTQRVNLQNYRFSIIPPAGSDTQFASIGMFEAPNRYKSSSSTPYFMPLSIRNFSGSLKAYVDSGMNGLISRNRNGATLKQRNSLVTASGIVVERAVIRYTDQSQTVYYYFEVGNGRYVHIMTYNVQDDAVGNKIIDAFDESIKTIRLL
jgi:hypothetical protein